MVGERVRFLFTSYEESRTNERTNESRYQRQTNKFFTTDKWLEIFTTN